MHQNAGSDTLHDRSRTGVSDGAPGTTAAVARDREPWKTQHREQTRSRNQKISGASSVGQAVVGFVQRNPLLASGAALRVRAAVVVLVDSRRARSNRVDRRAMRAARSIERTFAKEMRALRQSDAADRMGRFGTSLGDAFSRIDLAPLAERGRLYLEAARNRLGR